MQPIVQEFFDPPTNTLSYVVAEPDGGHCAIVDPVLDYDHKAGRTATAGADRIIAHVRERGLTVDWVLETHVHADHVTAAPYLKQELGGRIGIGDRIGEVQSFFKRLFNIDGEMPTDGSQFDRLFADGETFAVGGMRVRVLHTPGHTPADVTYVLGEAAFVGDTLFMPDYGTARADFPGADARTLYRSIHRLLELPPETRLYMCHDYMPNGRELRFVTTVAEQRRDNLHVRNGVSEDEFVAMREDRDRRLAMPALILPAVQINIRAGRLPPAEANGVTYLKIPLNQL